jgi:GINS complex subunit 3
MEIADHAHNPRGTLVEGVEFLQGLDEIERQRMTVVTCGSVENSLTEGVVFRVAQDSAKEMRVWLGEMKKK